MLLFLRVMRVALIVATVSLMVLPASDAWAKGGRGGGGGRGGFKGGGGRGGFKSAPSHPGRGGFQGGPSHLGRGVGKSGGGGFDPAQHASGWQRAGKNNAPTRSSDGANGPWNKHYAREQRKLDHRRQVADHLRDISDMNGNDQLRQVADDMDLRAQDHYDRQIQKINDRYGLEDGLAGDDIGDLTNEAFANDPNLVSDAADGVLGAADQVLDGADGLEDVARKLTGRENALYRQLRNEQRKLAQRMDAVERIRRLGQQSGDQGMLDAADGLEQRAMDHFDQRMSQITDFQQRHGLPDVDNNLAH